MVLTLALVALSAPKDLALRQPDSFRNDLDKVTALIQSGAHQGDAALFAPVVANDNAGSRAWITYGSSFNALKVIGQKNDWLKRGSLLDHPLSKTDTLNQAKGFSRVWFVQTMPEGARYGSQLSEGLKALGFRPFKEQKLEYEVVILFVR